MTYYKNQVLALREKHFLKPPAMRHLIIAKNYMDEHCGRAINLQTISEFSLLSKFHFSRLFKKSYGRTPLQYLTERRMKVAKHMLESGSTVIAACHEAGFESPNSFSAAFKKHTGLSPIEYRKEQDSIRLFKK